jgi:mRNA interferase MazF
MPGPTFEPYDVVAVPFPLADAAAKKRRPALVVSTRYYNDIHDQLVLAMITAVGGAAWATDTPIRDWRQAGLPTPCKVRARLFTLDKSLILKRLGALATYDRRRVGVILTQSVAAFS